MAKVTIFRKRERLLEKNRFFATMKRPILHLLLIAFLPLLQGCQKYPENPNRPTTPFRFTIYPNTFQYQEINYTSGWIYLTSEVESTSRGIIVYRQSENEFLAYDRLPPNEPDACTDNQGNTTRLVVDFPFVVDRCNNAYYNILNGQIIVAEPDMVPLFPTDAGTIYPLIQYYTQYDGNKLVIHNWDLFSSISIQYTFFVDNSQKSENGFSWLE